jgi:adenosine deaminase
VKALAPGTTLAEYRRDFIAPAKCANLADYLRRPLRIVALMQDKRGLRLMVEDVFDQLSRDGVIYAELRFAPYLHVDGGLRPEEVIGIVERATAEAIAATGIEARLILCTVRHFSREQSLHTAELAVEFRGSLVTALDIAGDEAGFPLDAHEPAFRYAEERGLHRTAHAGEGAGADSVREALRRLRPARIGHGVRAAEDEQLVAHLRANRIHLEVCPSSNIRTAMYETYADHPVDRLFRDGIHLSISTDARTVTDVSLMREHERLRAAFGWTDSELRRCNRNALEAAFVDEDTRARLLARLA